MSGWWFLPITLTLSLLCLADGSNAAFWMAVTAVTLNAALIIAQSNLLKHHFRKRRGTSSFFDV